MALSVHTNTSAMIALQNLNKTNEDIQGVQNKINTGLRVAGAKDNSSVYAVAQGMRSDIGALGSVKSSLDRAVSIGDIDVCPCGGTHVDSLAELGELEVTDRTSKGANVDRIEFVLHDPATDD